MEVLYNLQQHRLSLYKLNSNNKLIKYCASRGSSIYVIIAAVVKYRTYSGAIGILVDCTLVCCPSRGVNLFVHPLSVYVSAVQYLGDALLAP
jgi:hypothetical protein